MREKLLPSGGVRVVLRGGADFRRLLPAGWKGPSTNRELAAMLSIPRSRAARMTYCLARMGVLKAAARRGNSILFVSTISETGD
jgi:hypothetical protein